MSAIEAGSTSGATLDWARLERMRAELRTTYGAAKVPHAVIDGFLNEARAEELGLDEDLRGVLRSDRLGVYTYLNQSTESTVGAGGLPPSVRAIVDELHAPAFVAFLEEITGIQGLLPDPELANGGVFVLRPGGFMNLHLDDTIHPYRRRWRRRINLVLYLNRGWTEDYGGQLELWSRDGKDLIRKVTPVYNRCFLSTIDQNMHGMPEPVRCPEGDARKSISVWYYTEEAREVEFHPVAWKARPSDSLARKAAVFAEDKAYWLYHNIKWRMAIPEAEGAASRVPLGLMQRLGYTQLAKWIRERT